MLRAPHTMPGRATEGWWWLAGALLLAGCGGDLPPAEEAPQAPAPADEPAEELPAGARPAARLLADVAALGLDRVELGARPGADPTFASAGPPAPPLAEPARPLDRSSPEALLEGTLDALAREDLAALARAGAADGALDADDAADAERRFLGPSLPYWQRIAEAVARGDVDVVVEGARARAVVRVGGAAGAYVLRFRREEGGWVLEA